MRNCKIFAHLNDYWRNYLLWRSSTSIANKFLLALTMSAITGIFAQIKIYLPWTPVPITLQTYAVFLSPLLLGLWWGVFSQIVYVVLGVLGTPWFAGWKGGFMYIFAPTTGYLIGFIFAALLFGYIVEKTTIMNRLLGRMGSYFTINFVGIYVPGLLILWIWYLKIGISLSLVELLKKGFLPFIIGDLSKLSPLIVVTRHEKSREPHAL